MWPIIPSKSNEGRDARFVEFDKETYRRRRIVEHWIGWLNECRRILTRFEKRARDFLGMLNWAFNQPYFKTMVKIEFSESAYNFLMSVV
ncbi:hypothetical protein DTL21_28045 [Bremerella cremea]|uniref:Uncharacterized protein n=1 Tax=Blastopirellula marina TaxID=124 RepID=A0A2S8F8H9_9BACT|nr:hypothetical protein C5Y83_28000 [Blastopirellula marina]RCS41826.1 hypothetical protein DTL21_28045 [Bremerella cremea]